MLKIAVLVSGNGTNLQAIIDSIESGYLNCSIEMVISDREGIFGIERAKIKGIKTYVVDRKIYKNTLSDKILDLTLGKVDLIVLAGFLSILDKNFIECFRNKIINIHPSLIPAFCGPKMYGIKVHEKVVEYGVKYSGCTVHFVDEGTDTGAIIAQRVVPVYPEDTADILQQRVLLQEHKLLPEVIKLIAEKRIKVDGRKVIIL
ncbi:formyltetrahydrofolate-dependent phosphoribosylglycinamide formyltransferase [Clostridium sp. USBA 49]|uniref:phosphoribosylglycinamide formyltransferase n=1 Tax=Clostridium sp. USBA 49 TaxID=1881060 RepID=UPI000998F4BD|nr:phosphoribosylglycinamide formyltransferase [Clostridium sp. USBA 49]SKA73634.1 formyltetrahydrofolate-dependent phosphoribosylglycinamide formyltransferase [Clostridium sp. USBA 49]